MKKNNLGQYNTKKTVWLKPHIIDFIKNSGKMVGFDPFAGDGDLINVMKGLGLSTVGVDIDESKGWLVKNSLLAVDYYDNTIVITNPPYLAKTSAKRKKLNSYIYFDNTPYIDLYQIAIDVILCKYDYAIFIIPETYFLSDFFKHRLYNITILEDNPFEDTDCPVCVACFCPNESIFSNIEYEIYKNEEFVCTNIELEDILMGLSSDGMFTITFNDKSGNIGLRGIDGSSVDDKIRFCEPKDLKYDINNVKNSSRSITIINVKNYDKEVNILINEANNILNELRNKTKDLIISPFKNNNKIGKRRRRLDYSLARKIINKAIENINKGKEIIYEESNGNGKGSSVR